MRHTVVDALIIRDQKVLLTKRAEQLTEGGKWCLPGGYVDRDETVIEAVMREVHEEIGYTSEVESLVTMRDNPKRDVRQNISIVFFVKLIAKVGEPDPNEVTALEWFPLKQLPAENMMAFDHYQIIWEWLSDNLETALDEPDLA